MTIHRVLLRVDVEDYGCTDLGHLNSITAQLYGILAAQPVLQLWQDPSVGRSTTAISALVEKSGTAGAIAADVLGCNVDAPRVQAFSAELMTVDLTSSIDVRCSRLTVPGWGSVRHWLDHREQGCSPVLDESLILSSGAQFQVECPARDREVGGQLHARNSTFWRVRYLLITPGGSGKTHTSKDLMTWLRLASAVANEATTLVHVGSRRTRSRRPDASVNTICPTQRINDGRAALTVADQGAPPTRSDAWKPIRVDAIRARSQLKCWAGVIAAESSAADTPRAARVGEPGPRTRRPGDTRPGEVHSRPGRRQREPFRRSAGWRCDRRSAARAASRLAAVRGGDPSKPSWLAERPTRSSVLG